MEVFRLVGVLFTICIASCLLGMAGNHHMHCVLFTLGIAYQASQLVEDQPRCCYVSAVTCFCC